MHQLHCYAIRAILVSIVFSTGPQFAFAQDWDGCRTGCYPLAKKHCRFRLCKKPPRGRVAYSFTAVVNQDNPLNPELQNRTEEFDDRLSVMETQMNDLLTEFRVLMQVLAEEPPKTSPDGVPPGRLNGGGVQSSTDSSETLLPPPAPGALRQMGYERMYNR